MPCLYPLRGYWSKAVNASGKRSVVFRLSDGFVDLPVSVPCGQCIGCRLDRSREWAIRCVHEASLSERNCFITLTFDDEHLVSHRSLVKSDFQQFLKRLRWFNCNYSWSAVSGAYVRRSSPLGKSEVRYFHAGEYGELCEVCGRSAPRWLGIGKRYLDPSRCRCKEYRPSVGRPHHHACIFGYDFDDKVLFKEADGVRLYRSATLEYLWPFGYASVGEVNFESAAYVARYVLKKINGEKAAEHYKGRLPEYTSMSRRPGIGREWYKKFGKTDAFTKGFVVVRNGAKCGVPKYYSRCLESDDLVMFNKFKGKMQARAQARARLSKPLKFGEIAPAVVSEIVLREKVARLKRGRVDD